MGVTDPLQKAHAMSGCLLIRVYWRLLRRNDGRVQGRRYQSLAGLAWLGLVPARWAPNWSCEVAHLVLDRSVFQEVLRQDVGTVERVLLPVHEGVGLGH